MRTARSSNHDALCGFYTIAGERRRDALRGGLRVPIDDLQRLLAHEAVVLAQLSEAWLDRGAVNVVDDLVSDLADELSQVGEMEIAAILFLKLLLKGRHGDRRLLREFVAD